MNFTNLFVLIVAICITSCARPVSEFSKNFDISSEKQINISYDTRVNSFKVKIEEGHIVTRNGTKIELIEIEKTRFEQFVNCLETGVGLKLLHESGALKVEIRHSLFSRDIWRVENSQYCPAPSFFGLGSDSLEDDVDYSTPYWRKPLRDLAE